MSNHKLTNIVLLNPDQQKLAQEVLSNFSESQLIWFSGYLSGYISALQKTSDTTVSETGSILSSIPAPPINSILSQDKKTQQITVLYGTRTGNSKKVAGLLASNAAQRGINATLVDMGEYNPRNLKNETNLTVIVSTHGDGEPPLAAEEFYNFLNGTRATKLEHLQYSVLALGDKSYAQFCKTGVDIDKRLAELGAKKIADRIDCDVDFLSASDVWINNVIKEFSKNGNQHNPVEINGNDVLTEAAVIDRNKPYKAVILEKIKLNGRDSEKETYHFEISTKGSGIKYLPGDALGVYPLNNPVLIDKILHEIKLTGQENVDFNGHRSTLKEVLINNLEIGVLSRDVIEKHQQYVKHPDLMALLSDNKLLGDFLFGSDLLYLLNKYPYPYSASELVSLLRKLQPRLYSVASALESNSEEVHITVGALRYNWDGRSKDGTCSSFLSDSVTTGDMLDVFIEHNEAFRLPVDNTAPIIMIGPGTGVAPFRAFLQYRAETGAKGKNWLFIGDRHFTTDFLYQTEWLDYKKKGVLTNLSVAFSRDSHKKIYVQNKLREKSKEIMEWINNNAYIYVCGDMKHMAKDVLQTFIEIVANEKNLEHDQAKDFVQNLRKTKHYQEDVY